MATAAALLCTLRWAQCPTLYCQLDSGVLGFIIFIKKIVIVFQTRVRDIRKFPMRVRDIRKFPIIGYGFI